MEYRLADDCQLGSRWDGIHILDGSLVLTLRAMIPFLQEFNDQFLLWNFWCTLGKS